MSDDIRLLIRNFAQIEEADLHFGDLTVLVGAQATGKSLALQWLKTALDGSYIVSALRDAGYNVKDFKEQSILIDLIFGVGMAEAWQADTQISFNGKPIRLDDLSKMGRGNGKKKGESTERLFYIPAHRSMLISDGWPQPFQKLTSDTPVVARIFSQNLFERFSSRRGENLFPIDRVLKGEIRKQIDTAIFHGGTIGLDQGQGHVNRMKLKLGKSQLPFMTWTAGQREFTPLLLGLYHLLPPRSIKKRPDIDWVIIEEPEMGLHPEALTAFLLLILELMWRGYKVILSTHSPHVLTAVWMLKRLQQCNARWEILCDAFNIKQKQLFKGVAEAVLQKKYYVYLMQYGANQRVTSRDISGLDPGADDVGESGWGGLIGFSSRFGEAVRKAVNESGDISE